MQSGAPTFGTPEPALVLYVMAALARRLGVPFRSGGALTASKIPDAQAAYESANTMQPTILGGTNFVLHAAGWLEGGLAMGYEKFVLDADQLGMWHAFCKGVDLSDERAGARCVPHERARHALPRATRTRSPTSRRRSTAPRSRTARASSSGSPRARATRPTARERHLEAGARGVRAAPARRRRRRRARRVDRAAEGVLPGLRRMMRQPARSLGQAALRGAARRTRATRCFRSGASRRQCSSTSRPTSRSPSRSRRGRGSSTRSTSPSA